MLADLYETKDRGKSIAIAGFLPYFGPALGPIIGGLAAQHIWWPWLFWILSIFDAFILILGTIIIRETYGPVLLRRKAEALASARQIGMGEDEKSTKSGTTTSISSHVRIFWKDFSSRIGPAILIPVQLITHRPIILLLSLGMSIGFGVYTLILSNYASLFITQYHQSQTTASLHYISIAIGLLMTTQLGGHLMDYMWRRKCRARPDEEPTPEYRIGYMAVGLFPGVAGIFWYAWSANEHLHWIMVDIGMLVFNAFEFAFSQGLLAYQVDEFKSKRAASASAATRVWTYLLGFAFPIFAPELYKNLGYGWGGSLLGFLLLTMGTGIIVTLIFFGERIRQIGKPVEG